MSSNAPVRRRWTKEEDRVLRREAEYQRVATTIVPSLWLLIIGY